MSARAVSVGPLLVAALMLGVTGDALLRVGGPPGLNMSLWVAAIALSAYVLQRRAGLEMDRERVAWLAITVVFAAGLAWRDSTTLKPLALGCTTLGFALAAYRVSCGVGARRGGLQLRLGVGDGCVACVDRCGARACGGGPIGTTSRHRRQRSLPPCASAKVGCATPPPWHAAS